MTYEVAGGGRAGSAVLRDDQTMYTLGDRAARHATTGMTTLRTASENREGLLLYTYDAMRKETASGQNTYLIVPGSPNFRPLLDMLQRQSIQLGRLTPPATASTRTRRNRARSPRARSSSAPNSRSADSRRRCSKSHQRSRRASSKNSRRRRRPTSPTSSTT